MEFFLEETQMGRLPSTCMKILLGQSLDTGGNDKGLSDKLHRWK